MDRSKEIEQCCHDIRLEYAKLLRARRKAGQRKVEVTQGEKRSIIEKHADRYGLSAKWIKRIMATSIRHYEYTERLWHE